MRLWASISGRTNGSRTSPSARCSPTCVIRSEDGGATFQPVTTGLPGYTIRPNTMWGQGHPRALAVDPKNPQNIYLGIDGDAADGKSGGGKIRQIPKIRRPRINPERGQRNRDDIAERNAGKIDDAASEVGEAARGVDDRRLESAVV